MEKSTPPIGEPKATATPAALAAVTISLILPAENVREMSHTTRPGLTLTTGEPREHVSYHIANAAGDVDGRALFSDG